jgi:hypothetical protein
LNLVTPPPPSLPPPPNPLRLFVSFQSLAQKKKCTPEGVTFCYINAKLIDRKIDKERGGVVLSKDIVVCMSMEWAEV